MVVEEHELQIEKLKSDNSALRSALDLLKKTDTNQKAKLKKLMQENDNLKRDISKHRGIRRYTTSDKSDSQTQLDKLREEIDVTQAKLASLRDGVRSYALSLIDLTDANPQSGNTLTIATNPSKGGDNAQNDDFQVVTRRGRRQHDDVNERHNRQADGDVSQHRNRQYEGQPSGEATVCPVTPPGSVAPPGGQTSDQGRVTQRSPAGPQRKSYAGALRERLSDTVVIGTSLVRGVGARLHQRGIDNTVYSFPGAQLPLIRNRLDNILVPGKIPKNIVIQAAGNDVGHQRTDLVVREYGKLIKALKFRCPQSKIWLCKIPRRSRLSWLHSEIAKVNTFLEKSFHGKNVEFIDRTFATHMSNASVGRQQGPKWYDRELRLKRSAAIKAGENNLQGTGNGDLVTLCREYRSKKQRKQREYKRKCLESIEYAYKYDKHSMWGVLKNIDRDNRITAEPSDSEFYEYFKSMSSVNDLDYFDNNYEQEA